MADMSRERWFLPETPDVLGLLRGQVAVTIEGVDAFAAWAGGDTAAARGPARRASDRGDTAKRDALRRAARGIRDPAGARGRVRALPWHRLDPRLRAGSGLRGGGAGLPSRCGNRRDGEAARGGGARIDRALVHLGTDDDAATQAADAAIRAERMLERSYYQGMGVLLGVEDRNERIARRELYRRCARIGEMVIDVAERVVYAVVRQS